MLNVNNLCNDLIISSVIIITCSFHIYDAARILSLGLLGSTKQDDR